MFALGSVLGCIDEGLQQTSPEQPTQTNVPNESAVLSPNTPNYKGAYVARDVNGYFVVSGGWEGEKYYRIGSILKGKIPTSIVFSPDGKHMAYFAQKEIGGKWFFILDECEMAES